MARFTSIFLSLLAVCGLSTAKYNVPKTDYDVIIVGGGPAGLAAMSALCRVSRRAVLFDSAEYRNNKTRNMHDVLGADGLPPATFRGLAREQINKYDLGTFVNAKIKQVRYSKDANGHMIFTAVDQNGKGTTGRKLVLATGVTDVLPSTPGFWDAYGKGMYWCPWCDGFEHRGQSLAVVGPLSDALSSVLEMHNINPDTIVLTNGTDTPAEREKATGRSATWQKQLEAYNVPIVNNTIIKLERLRDGGEACSEPSPFRPGDKKPVNQLALQDQDVIPTRENAGPNGKHYDLFRIHFDHKLTMERAAILMNMATVQTSTLPKDMNLAMDKDGKVNVTSRCQALDQKGEIIPGLFAAGDMNNEGATNVPHAMYNGKKIGVVAHVHLAQEESKAAISKRSLSVINELHLERVTMESIGNELENIWEKIKAQYGSDSV